MPKLPFSGSSRRAVAPVLEVSDRVCMNCGANAPSAYCPACGQDTRERLPTFVQFMREATGRYLSFEGKLWKTLFALLFRPGFLTREYFAGRRRRYIGPAHLFLVMSLLLFAALRLASEAIDLDKVIVDGPGEAAASEGGAPAKAKVSRNRFPGDADDIKFDFEDLPESMAPLKKRIERFNHLPRPEKAEQLLGGALRYGPYAAFVLLPASAALLKLVYLGRRRRHPTRPRYYGEHLVFAAHNHAFLFIVAALMFAIPFDFVRQIAWFWIALYLAWSMHAVYRGSWLGIAVRGFILFIVYSILFALVTVGLLLVAVLMR